MTIDKKFIPNSWPTNQYFGLTEEMQIENLGLYDCWDDLEYHIALDSYLFVWTRKDLINFISRAVIILNRKY